jgi:Na+/H+ antiporter NhaD/arsenite permease-like protein
MVGAAICSYYLTKESVHQSNHFNFGPVKEVAILFIGIFGTMMPALDWLQGNAAKLNHATPGFFYFGSGALSSVLDNAPTYLCFLKALFGRYIDPAIVGEVTRAIQSGHLGGLKGAHGEAIQRTVEILQKYQAAAVHTGLLNSDQIQVAYILGNAKLATYLVAISIGAVFFGANTYIGNGPNLLVKAIADHQKVHTPTFLNYIWKFTLPFMVPMLVAVWLLFFNNG